MGVVWSPDGKTLASCGHGNKILLWDSESGEHIETLRGHKARAPRTYAKFFTREEKRELRARDERVRSVAFSPDGKTLVSRGPDRLAFWNTSSWKTLGSVDEPLNLATDVFFMPDGKSVLSVQGTKIVLWDAGSRKKSEEFYSHIPYNSGLAVSPDGKTVANGNLTGRITLWHVATRQRRTDIAVHTGAVGGLAFSPDSQILASVSYVDNMIQLSDTDNGESLGRLVGDKKNGGMAVAISPDGELVASDRADYSIALWNLSTKELCGYLSGHEDEVSQLSFSPDGTTLASASRDGTVKLWNIAAAVAAGLPAGIDPSPPADESSLADLAKLKAKAEKRRHHEKKGGFSYIPPQDWVLVRTKGLRYKTLQDAQGKRRQARLDFYATDAGEKWGVHIPLRVEQLRQQTEGLEVITNESFVVPDGMGHRVVCRSPGKNSPMWHYLYFVHRNDKLINLIASVSKRRRFAYERKFDAIVRSIQID